MKGVARIHRNLSSEQRYHGDAQETPSYKEGPTKGSAYRICL